MGLFYARVITLTSGLYRCVNAIANKAFASVLNQCVGVLQAFFDGE
ncbi:hypothetical protein [uncultured Nostoc sp.]